MQNYMNIDALALYCLGDIHGEYGGISAWLRRYDLQDACLVFCGDIGLGFNSLSYYQQVFSKLNRECKKRNEQKIQFSHIVSVPDYTVLSVANHNVLCVGGAVSIDRTFRMAKMQQDAVKYHHAEELDGVNFRLLDMCRNACIYDMVEVK